MLNKKYISFPESPPKLIVIIGPCRVGTTALANIFARSGIVTYLQPIKSAKRSIEQRKTPKIFSILKGDVAVVKETLGPRSEAEFFNPLKVLLKAGYPKQKLILLPILRDPKKTIASWREFWPVLEASYFQRAYDLTHEIIQYASDRDIKVVPYIHEAIRDNPPDDVVKSLFLQLGLADQIGKIQLDWSKGPIFGGDPRMIFFDSPPPEFIKEVKYWGKYQFREESYLKLEKKDNIFLKQQQGIYRVYENVKALCEKGLKIKIK